MILRISGFPLFLTQIQTPRRNGEFATGMGFLQAACKYMLVTTKNLEESRSHELNVHHPGFCNLKILVPALAFSADAPRAPSRPRHGILGLSVLLAGVVAKCVCVMQRWAVWSYRLVAGSCQRTSGIGRISKSFARACWLWQRMKDRLLSSGISEILGQLQDVCNGKPLAPTSDTRCP